MSADVSGEGDTIAIGDGVGVGVGAGVGVGVGVGLGERVAWGDDAIVGDGVGDIDGEVDGETDGVGVTSGVGSGVGSNVGSGVGVLSMNDEPGLYVEGGPTMSPYGAAAQIGAAPSDTTTYDAATITASEIVKSRDLLRFTCVSYAPAKRIRNK